MRNINPQQQQQQHENRVFGEVVYYQTAAAATEFRASSHTAEIRHDTPLSIVAVIPTRHSVFQTMTTITPQQPNRVAYRHSTRHNKNRRARNSRREARRRALRRGRRTRASSLIETSGTFRTTCVHSAQCAVRCAPVLAVSYFVCGVVFNHIRPPPVSFMLYTPHVRGSKLRIRARDEHTHFVGI